MWITLGLLALVVGISLVRVWVEVEIKGSAVLVRGGTLWLSAELYSSQKQAQKKATKRGKKAPSTKGRKKTSKRSASPKKEDKPSISWPMIKEGITTLWPVVKRTLGRTRKALVFDPFCVCFTFGALDDPAGVAQTYGKAHALVWALMPSLERLVRIPKPYVHLDIDFLNPQHMADATVGVRGRIGALVRIAIGLLIPSVRWYLDAKKRYQTKQEQALEPSLETQAL